MLKLEKKQLLKAITIALEILALALIIYLIFFPFYPALVYRLTSNNNPVNDIRGFKSAQEYAQTDENQENEQGNRIIIPKIGVNAPVIESRSAEYGLSKGSWRVPDSSTPDKGGNTVITGHRFKYLPPNNLTFYLLDKLEKDDLILIVWEGRDYFYRVSETKIVPDTELSILDPSSDTILTVFTCHPIYSTEKRLVVIADLEQSE